MELLYSLPSSLIKAKVLARPSKKVKSPYLADIEINGKEYLCHSPSLGCSGYIVEGATVWVLEKKSTNTKSSHEIYNVEKDGVMIGTHPLVANKIGYSLLKNQKVLNNINSIHSEFSINNCRFDFVGKCDNKMAVIEVKSVPIADIIEDENTAIFPYGGSSAKQKFYKEPLSQRALKHIETLNTIAKDKITVLLYVVQRDDVSKFIVSKYDPTYREAVKKAKENGVLIKAISIKWDNQHVYFNKELEVVL